MPLSLEIIYDSSRCEFIRTYSLKHCHNLMASGGSGNVADKD